MTTANELSCQELVELVTEYLEGTLSADERARFEAHLATCGHCNRYLEQMRQTIRTLRSLPEDALAPDARDELLRAFRSWRSGQ